MDTVKKEEEIKAPKIPPGFEFAAASETQKVDGNENDKIESKVTLMEYNDKDVGDGMQKVVESHIKIIAIEDYGNEDEEQKKLYSKINEVRRKSMDDKRVKENVNRESEAISSSKFQEITVFNDAETDVTERLMENDNRDNQMKDQQKSLPLIVVTPPEEIKYESEEADDIGDSEELKKEFFVIHQKEEIVNSDDQIDEMDASEVQDSIVEASETNVHEGLENQEEKIPAEIVQNDEKENMNDFQDYKDASAAGAEVQSNEAVEIQGNSVESSHSFSCENAIADRYNDVAEKREEQIENEGARMEVSSHGDALLDSANSNQIGDKDESVVDEKVQANDINESAPTENEESTQSEINVEDKDAKNESVADASLKSASDSEDAKEESDIAVVKVQANDINESAPTENEESTQSDINVDDKVAINESFADASLKSASDSEDAKEESDNAVEKAQTNGSNGSAPTENEESTPSEIDVDDEDAKNESIVVEKVLTNKSSEAVVDHQNSFIPSSVAPINNQNERAVAKPEQINRNERTQPTEEDLRSLVYPPGFKPEDLVFENQRKTTESEDDEGSIGIPVEVLDDKEADFLGDIGAFRIPSLQPCVASTEAFESPVIRDNTFDHFFITFFETDSSKLDVDAMKKVTEEILKNYVVSEDRYQILFKILFKIKDLQSKAILDQSLEFLQKLFANLDFDKFLLQFWSCDKFKARDLGPIGFSFTEGQHRYDFNGILTKDDSDAVKVKAKAVDAAWSMLLDVEATVTKMLDTCINNKFMAPFYFAVFRRFKCLGEYMIKTDGQEIPIFLYFYRKLIAETEKSKLITVLTCLINVCKSSKGEDGYILLKPNIVLCEIMNSLIGDDEKQATYILALRRFFTPTSDAPFNIEWNFESTNFDNPKLFLNNFIKYYNRKQSVRDNIDIFVIFEGFKFSLKNTGTELGDFEKLDKNIEIDWPFAYKVVKLLGLEHFKHQIPQSLFMILPEADTVNYISMEDGGPTLEKALIGIFELYFISGEIPETLYKNVWNTYPSPKSIIDVFARSVIEAYSNLRNSVNLEVNGKLIDFISDVYQCYDFDNSFGCAFELDVEFVNSNNHLMIIGRILRLLIEEKCLRDGKKPASNSVSLFFNGLINAYVSRIHEIFNQLREDVWGTWPPWRNGNAPRMSDEKSLAINHVINCIQKEMFCVYDSSWGQSQELMDLLFHLCKQRKYYGLNHPKLDTALQAKYPQFFEPRERPPQQRNEYGQTSNYQRDNGDSNYRRPQDDYNNQQQTNNFARRPDSYFSQQSQGRGGYSSTSNNTRQQDYNNRPPSRDEQVESSYPSNRGGGDGGNSGTTRPQNDNRRDGQQQNRNGYSSNRGTPRPPEYYIRSQNYYRRDDQYQQRSQSDPSTNHNNGNSGYNGFSAAPQYIPQRPQNCSRQNSESVHLQEPCATSRNDYAQDNDESGW